MAGTFGAVVEAGGTRHILSNNHVLANENRLPIGTPIFQPGLLDGGDVATDQIAELARFIAIDPDGPNVVDCAIAEVLNAETVCPTFLPRVGRLESAVPIRATAIEPAVGPAGCCLRARASTRSPISSPMPWSSSAWGE